MNPLLLFPTSLMELGENVVAPWFSYQQMFCRQYIYSQTPFSITFDCMFHVAKKKNVTKEVSLYCLGLDGANSMC